MISVILEVIVQISGQITNQIKVSTTNMEREKDRVGLFKKLHPVEIYNKSIIDTVLK